MTQETPPYEPGPDDQGPGAPSARIETHRPEAVRSLRQAMRRARFDDAERVGAISQHRISQIGRLEVLQDALQPLLAEIPPNAADFFDVGLMPGATPRLFIDMIGFVEMGRDARLYRLIQDTRYRRGTLAETSDVQTMATAVTDYVARRLLEREKALAADTTDIGSQETRAPATARARRVARPRGLRRVTGWVGAAFEFVIFLLGAIAFFGLLAAAGYYAWVRWQGQV